MLCVQDEDGDALLAFAASSGNVRSIELLLEYVPKVMERNECSCVGGDCSLFAAEWRVLHLHPLHNYRLSSESFEDAMLCIHNPHQCPALRAFDVCFRVPLL